MNEEEKKAIEELEGFIKGPCETCKYCEAAYKLNRKNIIQLLNLTKKLQKENELAKKQVEYDKTHICTPQIIKLNYISKQKVKDKIEELEEELEIMKVDNMYGRYKEYGGKTKWERLFATKYGMHDALQELLEGRKENESN